jgi:hypothetical protein
VPSILSEGSCYSLQGCLQEGLWGYWHSLSFTHYTVQFPLNLQHHILPPLSDSRNPTPISSHSLLPSLTPCSSLLSVSSFACSGLLVCGGNWESNSCPCWLGECCRALDSSCKWSQQYSNLACNLFTDRHSSYCQVFHVWVYCVLFIYSFVDEHFGGFSFVTVTAFMLLFFWQGVGDGLLGLELRVCSGSPRHQPFFLFLFFFLR